MIRMEESEERDFILDKYVLEIRANDIKDAFSSKTGQKFSRMFVWNNYVLVGSLIDTKIIGTSYDVSNWSYDKIEHLLIHQDFIRPINQEAEEAFRDLLMGAFSRDEKVKNNIIKQMHSSGLRMEGITLVYDFESLQGIRGIAINYQKNEQDQRRVSLFELLFTTE